MANLPSSSYIDGINMLFLLQLVSFTTALPTPPTQTFFDFDFEPGKTNGRSAAGYISLDFPMRNQTFYEGENLRLRCEITGYPIPRYEWYKDGKLIEHEKDRKVIRLTPWGSRLRISDVTVSDSGEYMCKAFNKFGEEFTTSVISVTNANNAMTTTNTKTTTASTSTPNSTSSATLPVLTSKTLLPETTSTQSMSTTSTPTMTTATPSMSTGSLTTTPITTALTTSSSLTSAVSTSMSQSKSTFASTRAGMAGTVRRIITTDTAPGPGGPYSQAVVADKTMYISGQIGRLPREDDVVPGGIVPETEQAIKNIGAVLEAAGATYKNVVKATVLLADIADFHKMNEVYIKYFSERKPARAAYQVGALPKNARVEIEAVAILGEITEA